MPIKPIDFQVTIPRTLDAAKAVSDAMQRNQGLQQQQASSINRDAEESLKQVYARSEAEQARIMEKQRERQQREDEKEKDGRNPDEKEKQENRRLKKDLSTSTIDIRI